MKDLELNIKELKRARDIIDKMLDYCEKKLEKRKSY